MPNHALGCARAKRARISSNPSILEIAAPDDCHCLQEAQETRMPFGQSFEADLLKGAVGARNRMHRGSLLVCGDHCFAHPNEAIA